MFLLFGVCLLLLFQSSTVMIHLLIFICWANDDRKNQNGGIQLYVYAIWIIFVYMKIYWHGVYHCLMSCWSTIDRTCSQFYDKYVHSDKLFKLTIFWRRKTCISILLYRILSKTVLCTKGKIHLSYTKLSLWNNEAILIQLQTKWTQ